MMTRFVATLAAVIVLVGCAHRNATSRPVDAQDRQEAALRDPMEYRPDMREQDISGGNLGNLDRGGMKRDVDHVLNP